MLKRLLSLSAVTALTASLLTGLATTPAAAADGTPPSLSSPTDGGTMYYDTDTTLRLDTSAQTVGESWSVGVSCTGGAIWWSNYTVDGSGTWSEDFSYAEPGQECDVTASHNADEGISHAIGSFNVEWTPEDLYMSGLTRSSSVLWPHKRDGYYDSVRFRWDINKDAKHYVTVRNAKGSLVKSATFRRADGMQSWAWGGRWNSGTLAGKGVYTIRVRATDDDGQQLTRSSKVTLRKGVVVTSKTLTKNGNSGYPATSGSCYVTRDSWTKTSDLDCWGGKYARVVFNFPVPKNATGLSWRIDGTRAGSDICCRGSIVKTARHVRSNLVQLKAQINGWRAYNVRRAVVHYKQRTNR
jgi:hypothetical protein